MTRLMGTYMKMFRQLAIATAVLIAATAHADIFRGTYRFSYPDWNTNQPDVVQFTFNGTLGSDGNTITDMFGGTLQVNGGAVESVDSITGCTLVSCAGSATASMDGVHDQFDMSSATYDFMVVSYRTGVILSGGAFLNQDFNVGTGPLVDVTTQTAAVPEPSTAWLVCAGFASFAGVGRMRRRR